MSLSLKELEAEVLHLDIASRARLAGKLLMSLDKPTASEIERLWLDEAERRLKEYCSGGVEAIPADEVFKRALADIA